MPDTARLRLEIVTIERLVYSGAVDIVLAPGVGGQLGILPRHTPLITALEAGELIARTGGREEAFAISGGFMEVLPDRVVVLANTAEPAEEIDVQRAQAARERASGQMHARLERLEAARAEAALRRSLARLRVARRSSPRVQPASRETLGEE